MMTYVICFLIFEFELWYRKKQKYMWKLRVWLIQFWVNCQVHITANIRALTHKPWIWAVTPVTWHIKVFGYSMLWSVTVMYQLTNTPWIILHTPAARWEFKLQEVSRSRVVCWLVFLFLWDVWSEFGDVFHCFNQGADLVTAFPPHHEVPESGHQLGL